MKYVIISTESQVWATYQCNTSQTCSQLAFKCMFLKTIYGLALFCYLDILISQQP